MALRRGRVIAEGMPVGCRGIKEGKGEERRSRGVCLECFTHERNEGGGGEIFILIGSPVSEVGGGVMGKYKV